MLICLHQIEPPVTTFWSWRLCRLGEEAAVGLEWLGRPRQLLLPINQVALFDADDFAEMLLQNLKGFILLLSIIKQIVNPTCYAWLPVVQTPPNDPFINLKFAHVGRNRSTEIVFIKFLHAFEDTLLSIPINESTYDPCIDRPLAFARGWEEKFAIAGWLPQGAQ